MSPRLLIVGHIVKDITADGWQAGGGALYAAVQAVRLGVETAVVTACERDVEPALLAPGAQWHVLTLDEGIRFENRYEGGIRRQRVYPAGRAIELEDIPPAWRSAEIALLAPVFHDVDPQLPGKIVKDGTSVAISAQGWLRRRQDGEVEPGTIEATPGWLHGDIVFLSDEDAVDADEAAVWRRLVPVVVVTRGRGGYTIWDEQGRHDVHPEPVDEADPTGAGDVFAAAFVVRYGETADARESGRFAAAAAAISVEGRGLQSVADRTQIEARLGATGARR